jgi:hypothetical protein
MRYTGRIDIRATSLSPLVHGAGTSGNSQLLRKMPVIQPDGTIARVPYLSANSIKHKLRASATQYALDAMGVEDRSLSKPEVDLLFSGGHLSKSGAAIDLTAARKIEELFPVLSLCGYSAGNVINEGKINVRHLKLVCAENAESIPDDLREHPALRLRAGAQTVEEFGTRHDMSNRAIGRKLLTGEAQAAQAKKRTKALAAPKEDGPAARGDSAQMIYEFGAVAAGATWWGSIWIADLTELEQAALASAFHYAATDRIGERLAISMGAKTGVGYGEMAVAIRGSMRIAPPVFQETALARPEDTLGQRYTEHLRTRKDEILAAIREAVA